MFKALNISLSRNKICFLLHSGLGRMLLMPPAFPSVLQDPAIYSDRWLEIAQTAMAKESLTEEEERAMAIRAGAHYHIGQPGVLDVEPFEIVKLNGEWIVFLDRAPDF